MLSDLVHTRSSTNINNNILKTETSRTSTSVTKSPFQVSSSGNINRNNNDGEDVEVALEECYKQRDLINPLNSIDFNRQQDLPPELLLKCLIFMGLEPYSRLYSEENVDKSGDDGNGLKSIDDSNGKSKSHCLSKRKALLCQQFIQGFNISLYMFIIIVTLLNPKFETCHTWTCNLPWISELFGYIVGLGLYIWMLKNINLSTIITTHRHRLDEWLNLFLNRLIIYWLVLSISAIIISQLPDCKNDLVEDRGSGPGNKGASGRLIALYVPLIVIVISPTFYFFVSLYICEALRLICIVEG